VFEAFRTVSLGDSVNRKPPGHSNEPESMQYWLRRLLAALVFTHSLYI
jgi:hypothetical protein